MEWVLNDTWMTALGAASIWGVAAVGIVVLPWTEREVRQVVGVGRALLRGVRWLFSARPRPHLAVSN